MRHGHRVHVFGPDYDSLSFGMGTVSVPNPYKAEADPAHAFFLESAVEMSPSGSAKLGSGRRAA